MGFRRYLAVSPGEFGGNGPIAWMACHFSPYGAGVTNLPSRLPVGSAVLLDDSTPITAHHSPEVVAKMLLDGYENWEWLILDFQREVNPVGLEIAARLREQLPCPVAAPPDYADTGCAVFLPPPPLRQSLRDYVQPWKGRSILLEAALEWEGITIRADGFHHAAPRPLREPIHRDAERHCHYSIEVSDDAVTFQIQRTRADLEELLEEGAQLGLAGAVGLFAEFPEGL